MGIRLGHHFARHARRRLVVQTDEERVRRSCHGVVDLEIGELHDTPLGHVFKGPRGGHSGQGSPVSVGRQEQSAGPREHDLALGGEGRKHGLAEEEDVFLGQTEVTVLRKELAGCAVIGR